MRQIAGVRTNAGAAALKAIAFLASLAGGMTLSMPRLASATEGGRYALLVGVEKYDPKFLVPLEYAEDDMEAVGGALENLGFNVITMTSSAEIPERRPVTAADILAQLERRLKHRESTDTVVLAFSGHGVQLKGEPSATEADRETWFCPERARLDDPATLLPMTAVVDRLRACPAKQKLLLVDACRAEVEPKAIRDKSGVPTIELDAAAPLRRRVTEGMAVLFSCGPRQKSYELGEMGHSVFTHFVIEYLEGRAEASRYSRQRPMVNDLQAYVSKETREFVDLRLNEDQIPEWVVPTGRFSDWSLGTLASVDRRPGLPGVNAAVPPPPPAIAPFNSGVASERQEQWARHLGTSVEFKTSLGSTMRLVPPGEFTMGGDTYEGQLASLRMHNNGERNDSALRAQARQLSNATRALPAHNVTLTKPFFMAASLITQGQYEDVMGINPSWKTSKRNAALWPGSQENSSEYGPDTSWDPVDRVSWYDAVEFCNRLSKREGRPEFYVITDPVRTRAGTLESATVRLAQGPRETPISKGGYRLATEAEWEFAMRAGSGFTEVRRIAVSNPFGIHQSRHTEWVFDLFAPYDAGPQTDPVGPTRQLEPDDPEEGKIFRVLRNSHDIWWRRWCSCLWCHRVGFRVVCE